MMKIVGYEFYVPTRKSIQFALTFSVYSRRNCTCAAKTFRLFRMSRCDSTNKIRWSEYGWQKKWEWLNFTRDECFFVCLCTKSKVHHHNNILTTAFIRLVCHSCRLSYRAVRPQNYRSMTLADLSSYFIHASQHVTCCVCSFAWFVCADGDLKPIDRNGPPNNSTTTANVMTNGN